MNMTLDCQETHKKNHTHMSLIQEREQYLLRKLKMKKEQPPTQRIETNNKYACRTGQNDRLAT